MGGICGRGRIYMASSSTPSAMDQQGPHFSPHRQLKIMTKLHPSGRMFSSGISDVVITSVHSV